MFISNVKRDQNTYIFVSSQSGATSESRWIPRAKVQGAYHCGNQATFLSALYYEDYDYSWLNYYR